jgi:putative oxidoreductase
MRPRERPAPHIVWQGWPQVQPDLKGGSNMDTLTQGADKLELRLRGLDIALLLLRAMIGVVFIAHGSQKLFGAFGGGLEKAAKVMTGFGLEPGMVFAFLAGILEFGGGLLLLVGLLTPLAGLIITGLMVVAITVSTGQKGFIAIGGLGYEYNLVLISIALALIIAGPGRLSFDHQLGLDRAIADRLRRSQEGRGVVGRSSDTMLARSGVINALLAGASGNL